MKKFSLILLLLELNLASIYANDSRNFMERALKFSGADSSLIASYLEKVDSITENYLECMNGKKSRIIAEETLLFMYDNCLRTYMSSQTRMDVLLDSRKYNCVSSSLLYMYFMKIAHVPCVEIQTKEHAFCEVFIDDRWIRVETTNPYGFEPGTKKEKKNGYYNVPARNYANPKRIDDNHALSLILRNRIAQTSRKNPLEAFELAVECHELCGGDEESSGVLQAAITNAIGIIDGRGNTDEAISFGRKCHEKYRLGKEARQNYDSAVMRKVMGLNRTMQFDLALEFIEKESDIFTAENVASAKSATIQNKAYWIYDNEGFDSAMSLLNEQKVISQAEFSRIKADICKSESIRYHNESVPFMNKKDYETALKIIEEGLKKIPDSQILLRDKSNLIRQVLQKS
ncbi:hypothetical protein [Treponema sp.]|uniref:hypothetical protein n=1 Tax=Treponema sp. TaxID=166 RepID=UPI00388E7020